MPCFFKARLFFRFIFGGFVTTWTLRDALDPECLVLLVGTLREMMLRSIAEQEPVFISLVGFVLRERDLELDCFEVGLLNDFLDYDRSDRPKDPLLLVFL